ncbi:MAG: fumarylacetoacetate hydrolase family protein [bacterium]|nr:fumarylacetoacetate hydrolase family protein [bacterium]
MAASAAALPAQTGAVKYVRFESGGESKYGVLRGEEVFPIEGNLFRKHEVASTGVALSSVKLLYPCRPRKLLAVGLNYRSHIGNRPAPKRPEIFYKPISALQNPGDPIVIPAGAKNVHYEGELVLVIGRRLKDADTAQARRGIFGITCGNDVSERDWQNGPDKDLQWWRAKGADTFAPMGPVIAKGIDYSKLLLQTRLNGEVVQKQYSSDLVFDPPAIVSWVSKHVTLWPGDVIFTGTPGSTKPMKPGDVVEVEIEGVGVLRNTVK